MSKAVYASHSLIVSFHPHRQNGPCMPYRFPMPSTRGRCPCPPSVRCQSKAHRPLRCSPIECSPSSGSGEATGRYGRRWARRGEQASCRVADGRKSRTRSPIKNFRPAGAGGVGGRVAVGRGGDVKTSDLTAVLVNLPSQRLRFSDGCTSMYSAAPPSGPAFHPARAKISGDASVASILSATLRRGRLGDLTASRTRSSSDSVE